MSIDPSTGMPFKEPELTPNEMRKNMGLPPIQPIPKPSKAPVVILSILLMFVTLVSAYLFATAPTGICADQIAKASNSSTSASFEKAYKQGVSESRNSTLLEGYSKCLSETQNATLLLGYCTSQQEFVKNGVMAINNTVLVVPVSTLKPICFR